MANETQELTRSIEKLAAFARDLEDQIAELANSQQDRSIKKHRATLEKLLGTTNKILKKQGASAQEVKDFDKLVASAELTSRTVQQQHKDDTEFRKEFEKSNRNLLQRLDAIPESVKAIAQTATAKDVAATSSAFLTGPFGSIFKDVAGDFRQGTKTLVDRFKGDGGAEGDKGSFARGISSIGEDGSYRLHRGERVVPQDDNERLSDFLAEVSGIDFTQGSGGADAHKPVEVGFKTNDPGIGQYFDRVVDAVARNTVNIYGKLQEMQTRIVENIQVIHNLMSNIGSDFWGNNIIRQQIWWKRFNRHPVLNSIGIFVDKIFPLLISPLTLTLKALTGGLFGRKKKSIEEESLIALRSIQRILEGREVFSDVGKFRKAFRGFFDVPGRLFGTGQKRAQQLEERRARGQRLTQKEQSIIERNIEFITRRKGGEAAGIGGARVIEGEVIRNIDDNVSALVDTQKMIYDQQYDSFRLTQKQQKQLLDRAAKPDWLKSLMEDIQKTFSKGKEKGKGLFASLGNIAKSIFGVLKTGILTGISLLGPVLASAAPWAALAGKVIGGIGLAFTAGGLVGKYIVTPIIELLDKTFKTDILGFIGKMTTEIIAWFENNVPGFKTIFGTEAGATVARAQQNENFIGFDQLPPDAQARVLARRAEIAKANGNQDVVERLDKLIQALKDKTFETVQAATHSVGGVEDLGIARQGQN